MENQLQLLWQVQLLEKRGRLLEKQKSQVNTQEVYELRERAKAVAEKLALANKNFEQLKNICDKQELDLSDVTVKYRQIEKLLYGGEIKSLKEIEQLKEQYDVIQVDIAKQEQDYFHTVDASDETHRDVLALEKLLQENKENCAKKQQKISDGIAAINAEIETIKMGCQDLLNKVDPAFIKTYNSLKQKMSFPIAELKNGICGGCRMGLPESKSASRGQTLQYCDHCGRILITVNKK